ncbi:MAG: SDR family NAD(P)-dependent oxidoreductase [Ignavibacteriaceae bacterium]|nr:SDR family NAD(P)-dependent oxidoreductase [Ignavibacteriaceae bacterium]
MNNSFDIAIIGMSCRFPGADDLDSFWNNLANGVESISHFSDEELRKSGIPESLINNPNYVKAAPIINEPGMFDASFFGYTPMEAKTMDPQHRILLECAHQALEHSGYDAEKYKGRIGVFTGSAMNTYFMNNILRSKFVDEYIPTLIGNDKDFLSTRISYKLNLKGPSINVQTACSTSLVAVHLACQSLISEESDMVLAGAVSVKAPHTAGYICDGGGIVSKDAHVRAFDAKANGTVFGSGCGVVVLKRLSDAIKDNDTIHGVIKGSAINNDGSEKAGYTAPSVNSQADAVIEALSLVDINANTISYIEAHGSGTPLGDPIELAALTKAFRNFTNENKFCAVGSVKTNVGHLDAAAGMAGLIKTLLSLKHKKIPPSINFSEPNPEIDFASSPFFVNYQLSDWKSIGPRRAGIMSTGMGGTNAYLILEEAPEEKKVSTSSHPNILLFSAKSETALSEHSKQLSEFLEKNNEVNINDVAYTLQQGRKKFNHRRFLVSKDRPDTIEILEQEKSKRVFSGKLKNTSKRPVIFLFPGIGDHYVGMGYDLYQNAKIFTEEVDRCADILKEYLDLDIRDILYPKDYNRSKPGNGGGIDLKKMLASRVNKAADVNTQKLNQTLYAQPALFTIEYALAKLWLHLDITPDAIVGHSMGEYVAACLAGVFSLEDTLKLIAIRAKLVNDLPQGGMLAVTLPEDELTPLLSDGLSISLINSPNLCVVAGPEEKVNQFEGVLKNKKILYRQVQNAHAFHSKMLDPIYDDYTKEIKKIKLNSPKIPFTSNLTGNWITDREATDPIYWAKHANNTARFSNSLEKAWQMINAIFLEVGPGNTLSVLAMQHPESKKYENPVTISTLRPEYDNQFDLDYFFTSIGKFWLSGTEIDWEKLYQDEKPKRIPLPTYSFQRENYWIEDLVDTNSRFTSEVSIHKTSNISEWFYVPSWKRLIQQPILSNDLKLKIGLRLNWLVFLDDMGIASSLVERLRNCGQVVVTVKKEEIFNFDNNSFTLTPSRYSDYELLIKKLKEINKLPDRIIHAWSLSQDSNKDSERTYFNFKQEFGFFSTLFLSKALAKNNISNDMKLFILSNNLQEVVGSEELSPEKATVIGPCMVIPQEYPNIKAKSIDLDINIAPRNDQKYIDYLTGELLDLTQDVFVAYRSNNRWVQSFEPIYIKPLQEEKSSFRIKGVYLITGGLGEIGYEMALYLAEKYKAKLVLVGRSELPERENWTDWEATQSDEFDHSNRIEKIKRLESLGGEVSYLSSDVSDFNKMQNVIKRTEERFGKLNGVIHAAGIVGEKGFFNIHDLDFEKCHLHFQAKVNGLYNLDKVLKGKDLDFCMLLSSLTPILGGLGEVAYASSNIFMDVFARKHNRNSNMKWISVNWDLWRIQKRNIEETGFGKTLTELGILPSEGMEAMERILSLKDVSQFVVSTGDLNKRIKQWITLESLDENQLNLSGNEKISKYSQRPVLEVDYSEPQDETQELIAGIWRDVLGIDQIGIYDNFAQLGGHSLLAIKIISELRKAFMVDLPISALFDTPTINELAEKIKEIILVEIQQLSDEDVKKMNLN